VSLETMLRNAATAADHHVYYRTLNRAAGAIAVLSSRGPDSAVFSLAEKDILDLERSMGADFTGYAGRPLFRELRKRVAETLVELGY